NMVGQLLHLAYRKTDKNFVTTNILVLENLTILLGIITCKCNTFTIFVFFDLLDGIRIAIGVPYLKWLIQGNPSFIAQLLVENGNISLTGNFDSSVAIYLCQVVGISLIISKKRR
ncbi:MAG: hypothetical protein IKG81_14580, partial [Bacteroidales bacterium]|nr:hypothetical protein [Bacteroidales bacterium]